MAIVEIVRRMSLQNLTISVLAGLLVSTMNQWLGQLKDDTDDGTSNIQPTSNDYCITLFMATELTTMLSIVACSRFTSIPDPLTAGSLLSL